MLTLMLSALCFLCFLLMLALHWAIKQNVKLFHTHTIELSYFEGQSFFMLYHKNAEGDGLLNKQQSMLDCDLIVAMLNYPEITWVARDEHSHNIIQQADEIKLQRKRDLVDLHFTGGTDA